MSIWDDKEHIIKIEISGVKSWKCNWCNRPPTAITLSVRDLVNLLLTTSSKQVPVLLVSVVLSLGYLVLVLTPTSNHEGREGALIDIVH